MQKVVLLCFCLVVVVCLCMYSDSDSNSNLCTIEDPISYEDAVSKNNDVASASTKNPPVAPEVKKENVSGEHYLTEIENQVMDLINKERLSLGLMELEFDPRLQNAARIRSKELCQDEAMRKKKLSHTRPDGRGWETVLIEDIPISGLIEAGEILARESTSNGGGENQSHIPAKDWFLLWKSSKPHYDTITWPEAQKVGVGIYYEIDNGEYYTNATVLFGRFHPEELNQSVQNPCPK